MYLKVKINLEEPASWGAGGGVGQRRLEGGAIGCGAGYLWKSIEI